MSDFSQAWQKLFESESDSAVSTTEAEVCNCFGSIHIMSPILYVEMFELNHRTQD